MNLLKVTLTNKLTKMKISDSILDIVPRTVTINEKYFFFQNTKTKELYRQMCECAMHNNCLLIRKQKIQNQSTS